MPTSPPPFGGAISCDPEAFPALTRSKLDPSVNVKVQPDELFDGEPPSFKT